MKPLPLALLVVGLSTVLALPIHAAVESVTIATPRGEQVPADLHLPDSSDAKLPVLILAPGGGYHSLNVSKDDQGLNPSNVDAAAAVIVQWMKLILTR